MDVPPGAYRSPFLAPIGQDYSTEEQDESDQVTEWTNFFSMSVSKGLDGKYTAKIKFQGENGDMLEREYIGTRQEVRDLVVADDECPESQKQKLLRSLDDRANLIVPPFEFPRFPSWGQELFNWRKS